MDSPKVAEKSMQVTISTLNLREKIRYYTKSHREQLRANSLDSLRFGIGEIKARIQELDNLTEKDVIGLAGRIKRRKHATNDDMYRLSHAFLQDENNIEAFTKIPGAMNVLIKEFTGKDSERQLGSAECLCNLSLGRAHVCEKISTLAGSYLVTYLRTSENQLVRMCLWTIANILKTDIKSALTLMKMQLLPQLWKLYAEDNAADIACFQVDAAICLQLIALNSEELIKQNDVEYVLLHLDEKNPTCLAGEYHLQIIFHILFSNPDFVASLTSPRLQYLISYSLTNICNTKEFKTDKQHLRIIYSIRVLGNLVACHSNCYSKLLHQITTNWQTNLTAVLNKLFSFQNAWLTQEVLWLLKNILNYEKAMNLPLNSFIEKLKIPASSPNTFSAKNDIESMSS